MNRRAETLITEMSACSTNSISDLTEKICILEAQNADFKRRWEVCNMLNLTLTQALINISKTSRIDPELMGKLKQLSVEAANPSSPETLGELREFYEEQIKIREYKNNKVVEELRNQHREELRIMREKLEREYKERISRDREQMLKEVHNYMDNKQTKGLHPKENRKTPDNSTKRRKSFSQYVSKSTLSNSLSNIERSSLRSDSKLHLQPQQPIKLSSRANHVATQLKCTNCTRSFAPNQFITHLSLCKNIIEYQSQRSQNKNELLNQLLKRKRQIQNQLNMYIQYNAQSEPREVLQTELDEIVCVINNKSNVSSENIEKILKRVVNRFR